MAIPTAVPLKAPIRVNFYFFESKERISPGCGYTTIGLLTGETPSELRKQYKNIECPDKVIIKHLKSKGFVIHPLDDKFYSDLYRFQLVIQSTDVLLVSLQLNETKSTWGILYEGMMYHNFECTLFSYTDMLTMKVITAYIINHPNWSYKN